MRGTSPRDEARRRHLYETMQERSRHQLHGSSREMGSVMHRGPPPPRTSSPPSKVIAARSPSRRGVSPARKSPALMVRNPIFSSSLSVASLRPYEVTTPGRIAQKLHPDDHCSRSW